MGEEEINNWKTYFNLQGTKTHFERNKKTPRQTLLRVLNTGTGKESVIKKIRAYMLKQSQTA